MLLHQNHHSIFCLRTYNNLHQLEVAMSRVFVVLTFILATSTCEQQKLSAASQVPQSQSTNHIPVIENYHEGKKFSTGEELTSLAHTSAQQATAAVKSQQSAGLQAALGAQSGYARAALEAASAAKVALVAKQVIVENLRKHVEEAEHILHTERAQYEQTLRAAVVAQSAIEQTQQQLSSATSAVAAIENSILHSQRAAAAASQAAAAQHHMVQEAEQRLRRLHDKLEAALEGLEETEVSAHKAGAAAEVAQTNAAASAHLANSVNEDEEHGEELQH